VQATLEQAIESITGGKPSVVGSGRTDAGAHALRQVVAFSTESTLGADVLRRALNATLPADIAVTSAQEVRSNFHPRFDASSRVYRYLIWNRPVRSPFWHGRAAHVKPYLEVDAMHEAAQHLTGTHDFGAFVPRNLTGSRTRTVYRAECRRDGDVVSVELEADGFMRQMVRSIVGTLVRVGLGKIGSAEFGGILASLDRKQAATTAPAAGLYLAEVRYPNFADESSERISAGILGHPSETANRSEEHE
jgi:tRNA pseudouridine38-40 synthase